MDNTSFSLFTGCLIRARFPHLEKSARAVFETLGIQFSDLKGASCCPDPVGVRGIDHDAWLTLAARNLALAGNHGHTLMSLCSGCYSTLREAQYLLTHGSALSLEKVHGTLEQMGYRYSPGPAVEHFARFLVEKVGADELSSRMTRSWQGLPVAVHHGCHFLRPSHIIDFDDPENPTRLEELVRSLGAEVVDYPRKMLCCGFAVQGMDSGLSLRMAHEKLVLMREAGARAVIVICPACYLQFDLMQPLMEREFGDPMAAQDSGMAPHTAANERGMAPHMAANERGTSRLPVLYLTEFIGLALGLSTSSLGLNLHRVDVRQLVQEVFPEAASGTSKAPS